MGGALIGLFFFATLYLQQVLGYGPLKAGARVPAARADDRRLRRASPPSSSTKLGPRPVLVAGPAGPGRRPVLVLATSRADGSYLGDVLFPSLVVALGMGLAFVPLTIAGDERRERDRVRPGQRR